MRSIFVAMALSIAWLMPVKAGAKTLRVVASFTILADLVREVGGVHVDVQSLVPPDGDLHRYEPSPNDARRLKQADVVFVSGIGLESWFAALTRASGYAGEPVAVSLSTSARNRPGEPDDAHVWNSLRHVKVWVNNIASALSAADPASASDYRYNASRYEEALNELDRWTRDRIEAVPIEKRKVLTSHNAFGYFAHDYGVTILSPAGLSSETEASAAGVAQLIEQIRREKIITYFPQNSGNTKLVAQIGLATGARPGGKLYGESLSDPSGPAPTFLKMFRYNVEQLTAAMARS